MHLHVSSCSSKIQTVADKLKSCPKKEYNFGAAKQFVARQEAIPQHRPIVIGHAKNLMKYIRTWLLDQHACNSRHKAYKTQVNAQNIS